MTHNWKCHSWDSTPSPISCFSPTWTLWFSQSALLRMNLKEKMDVKCLVRKKCEWRWRHIENSNQWVQFFRGNLNKLWQGSLKELYGNQMVTKSFCEFHFYNLYLASKNNQLFVVLRGVLWDVRKCLVIFDVGVYCQHMCVYISIVKLLKLLKLFDNGLAKI